MKTLNKIPVKRMERAGKLLRTGVKIGENYLKYYGSRFFKEEGTAREALDENNARDIYDSLKELKGSALKVAQMLSMERGMLPEAYVEKFSLSQFSVPPLSGALVKKTFRKYFGKNPEQIFDEFSPEAVNAATIGQVHKAKKKGKELAVKIQYPGVKDSISSDLKMVKPVAMKMFNIRKEGSEKYFKEVEDKLMEETDYTLELKRSMQFAEDCKPLPHIRFPRYYPKYSCDKILTMDWMHGIHFSEFIKENPDQKLRNQIGQTLWDFYMYQVHALKRLHADPHPGNFLVSKDHQLLVIDFGCMKEIPEDFYRSYFLGLASAKSFHDEALFEQKLYELEMILPGDSPKEKAFLKTLFGEMVKTFTEPLRSETFDFSNNAFFDKITNLGQHYARLGEMRAMNTNRGSQHFIYVNRTFLGLYNLMHALKAEGIKINQFRDFL